MLFITVLWDFINNITNGDLYFTGSNSENTTFITVTSTYDIN